MKNYIEILKPMMSIKTNLFYMINFWALFIIYASYQAFVFLSSNSMVPDELMFIWMAKNYGFSIFDNKAPPVFYGSIYWAFLQIFETPLLVRTLCLVFFLTIPFSIIFYVLTWRYRFLSLLLYISFPFSFWSGKLIGPEIMSIFLVSLALIFLVRRPQASMFIGGIAVGVKLSTAPCLIFMGGYAAMMRPKLMQLFGLFLACLFGLWVANPFNLPAYILAAPHNNFSYEIFYTLFSDKTYNILFVRGLTWDSLISASFVDMVMRPLPYLLYITLLLLCSPLLFVLVAAASILLLLVIVNSNTAYVWYFFGILPIYLFAIKGIECANKFKFPKEISIIDKFIQYRFQFFFALTVINLYQNMPTSIFQISQKYHSIYMLENLPKSCIKDSIFKYSPDQIINQIEYGYELNDLDLDKRIVVKSGYDPFIVPGKKTLILVGHRFLENSKYLEDLVKSSSVVLINDCNKLVYIYEVSK